MESREEKLTDILPSKSEIRRVVAVTEKLSDDDFNILVERLKKGKENSASEE